MHPHQQSVNVPCKGYIVRREQTYKSDYIHLHTIIVGTFILLPFAKRSKGWSLSYKNKIVYLNERDYADNMHRHATQQD